TVSSGKLPRQPCCDLLVLAEVIWYATACQHPDGFVRDTGFAGCGRMGVQLILGLPAGAHREDYHFATPQASRRVLPLAQSQLRRYRRHGRVEQRGVERADESA